MTSWISDAIGAERLRLAEEAASRRRITAALGIPEPDVDEARIREIVSALEMAVFDHLADGNPLELRKASAQAFQLARVLTPPEDRAQRMEHFLWLGCLAMLGDRGPDVRRLLNDQELPIPSAEGTWGTRVWETTLDTWLRLIRKRGWEDLDRVLQNVLTLRREQKEHEARFLENVSEPSPAWQLVAEYHLVKASEEVATFLGQGSTADGSFDIREQLESQFERAIAACGHGRLMALEVLVRLLERTANALVANSIWTVTRAVNTRVTKFVQSLVARAQERPLFEMLPPQRRALREEGLLGSSRRSVVVSLPTSSGKTLIAQFRILQALNQFDQERGWVAYLAPTRALVKQIAVRLRRDFGPIGVVVEQVSPALEIDGFEAAMLAEQAPDLQFRVLLTTPEKLDLMLRSGWEEKIGRPLTLVVVDEAHNLALSGRGIKLELLLATINRDCRYAQFLLLTPFIENAKEIAAWLDRESNQCIGLEIDWRPNDRMIALAENVKGSKKGDFQVKLHPIHTTRETLTVPEDLLLSEHRPLGLSWSDAKSKAALAAATAHQLRARGPVIVLVGKVAHCLSLAEQFQSLENRRQPSPEVQVVKSFLAHELGESFPLVQLLDYRVGVHNAGMSDETRALVEWLFEAGHLDVVVATTTIAQGVNFPVAGVVMAAHQYPYGKDMPPADFWNLAGRVGRVDQGDLGVIALATETTGDAAQDHEARQELEEFVGTQVGALSSALLQMVQQVDRASDLEELPLLAHKPEWSSFLQYLAHTYRMIGNHERFVQQVERVLRGTLGFQSLRQTHPQLATHLLAGVYGYSEKMQQSDAGRLALVDYTGFSLESVNGALGRLQSTSIGPDSWTPELFDQPRPHLHAMMGILLSIPELRGNFESVIRKTSLDGESLAHAICDWVQGASMATLAGKYFKGEMTVCCQMLFQRINQTAAWGLSALQTLTMGSRLERLSEREQRTVRNLPARVYYGVSSDRALALRLVGVPRTAAEPLAMELGVTADTGTAQIRERLRKSDDALWRGAMGEIGVAYRAVWRLLEGTP